MVEAGAGIQVTDEALISRIAAGDAVAFGEFYDRHANLLFGLAMRIVQDTAEAEDVVQEAAVLVWERAAMYDSALGRPVSWAVTLVRNKAIDRLRALRRRGAMLEKARESAEPEAAMEHKASDWCGDSSGLIRRALTQLPVEQRRAIELAFFGGLSQAEIADELGQPLGTVKARIRRGMLAMRDALEGAL